LFAKDRARIATAERAGSALRVHEQLQKHPFLTAAKTRALTGLTIPTINTSFGALQRLGIVTEVTGRSRDRVYCYKAYVDLLDDGA
jgi:Fic family protein